MKNREWPRTPVDYFVLDRLARERLAPSSEADRTTLIRRVTLDITGLPPTPAEVDAFLADESPDAYERLVDRLLASPRYGERMAAKWLDLARYADTSGYQNDGPRFMWRWRDWVIDAYNRNMPFDQFTIEQIAGDLLPDTTLQQKIATGFNRNHRGNSEGGIIPEEYAVEYVVDRVETTCTVWLGLTMGCTRCHDHKYDPLKQREFYQLFAYFNNLPEHGRSIKEGNSPPFIMAPTDDDQRQLRLVDEKLVAAEQSVAAAAPRLAAAQAEWEKTVAATTVPADWSIPDGLVVHYPLDSNTTSASGQTGTGKFVDGDPAFAAGRSAQAAEFDGRRFIDAGDVANFGYFDRFSLAAWIYPTDERGGTIVSRMTDVPEGDGYCVSLVSGKVQVNLVKRWLDDAVRVETERTLAPGRWHHVMVTYDGSRQAKGITIYVDGQPEKQRVNLDFINQTFAAKEPLRIGAGGGPEARFHGSIDDVRVYSGCLSADDVRVIATPDSLRDILAAPADQRRPEHARKLRTYFLAQHAPDEIRQAHRNLVALRNERERLVESIPTVMVMDEMSVPRDTFMLVRGQYDKPGEGVTRGVPAILSSLPPGASTDRLGLAQWLVDPANPLTARVAVNRLWQMFFGTGLVKTGEDFGTQGDPPSHPELLDWLATEFVRSGWDVKTMQKLIVTSATYRQSSKVSPALVAKDPENRLLARGPRFRLSAEMIRDQALAAGGLLVEQIGGPSVKPYQPDGLWQEIATDKEYVQDHGDKLYRRSLYTYWKRTVSPPSMMTFDASARETCTARVTRTNTPLQALTLMNDVTYVEAARVLAQRVMTEGGPTPEDRITLAFRLATGRRPHPAELEILLRGFRDHLVRFRQDSTATIQLIKAGESPLNARMDPGELAAYTALASLIMNLDETITRE